jgi:hypothetical protein
MVVLVFAKDFAMIIDLRQHDKAVMKLCVLVTFNNVTISGMPYQAARRDVLEHPSAPAPPLAALPCPCCFSAGLFGYQLPPP